IARKVFKKFNHQLDKANLMAKSGQIVDASFVEVPRQRNSRDDNMHIKTEGTYPEEWSENKKRQKDIDACWTEKNKQKHFGYKNHIAADRKRKFIINYEVTSAEVHDSQPFFDVLGKARKKNEPVWGDSAYRSEHNEKRLAKSGFISKIHEKGYRNRPLTDKQKARNTIKSRTRARVEHIFGSIHWFKGNYRKRQIHPVFPTNSRHAMLPLKRRHTWNRKGEDMDVNFGQTITRNGRQAVRAAWSIAENPAFHIGPFGNGRNVFRVETKTGRRWCAYL